MKKLTVLIDMDDTIENLCECWVKYLNLKFDRQVKYEDVRDWDLKKSYPGLSDSDIFGVLSDERVWDDLRPKERSVKVIQSLISSGHDVYIVTSSTPETVWRKSVFLTKYFPFLSYKKLIVAHNKQMIRGDIMIDDNPRNLENGQYTKFLMDAPHNRNYNCRKGGCIRVHNWDEIYGLICSYSNWSDLKMKQGEEVICIDEIILYSTGCPKCDILKKKLNQKDIRYKENNSVDEMMALGIENVPVLSVNGELKDFSAAVSWINNK